MARVTGRGIWKCFVKKVSINITEDTQTRVYATYVCVICYIRLMNKDISVSK
jgi:hypothetical protein